MKALIVANGKFKISDVIHYQKEGYYTVVCDGAADKLLKGKIMFDFVVGDMDSVSKITMKHIKQNCKYLMKESQDITDLEFAINVCMDFASEIIILGCIAGDRLDHMLMNLALLKKKHSKDIPIIICDSKQSIIFLHNQSMKFESKVGKIIGFFGFPHAKIKCVSNLPKSKKALEWDLKNYVLDFEKSSSVANIIKSKSLTIEVNGDCLVIIPKISKYYIINDVPHSDTY